MIPPEAPIKYGFIQSRQGPDESTYRVIDYNAFARDHGTTAADILHAFIKLQERIDNPHMLVYESEIVLAVKERIGLEDELIELTNLYPMDIYQNLLPETSP